MYCKNCGKPIDDDSKFCKHCGNAQQPGVERQAEPKYLYCHIDDDWLDQSGVMDGLVNRRKRVRMIAVGEGLDEGTVYAESDVFASKDRDLSKAEHQMFEEARFQVAKQLEADGWTWIGKNKYDWRFRRSA